MYSRPISLSAVETYYKGESDGMKKIMDGRMHFNPLFVCRGGKTVDIYYDINNPDTEYLPMVDYFIKHPKEFDLLVRLYIKECAELLKLIKKPNTKNFTKIINLVVSAQVKSTLAVIIGRQHKIIKSPVVVKAYKLREKTDRILYRVDNALLEIGKLLKPSLVKYIDFLTIKELSSSGAPIRAELAKRIKSYMYFEGVVYAGKSIKWLEKRMNIKILADNPDENFKTGSFIKGTTAMPGKVQGKVKIIFNSTQVDKINKGDVIVTPMTTPDFISAMKKAVAIITDEGGITCHAAIIARELKKPCIISTKIATKFFHDGDLVEVDANAGIVKKLS